MRDKKMLKSIATIGWRGHPKSTIKDHLGKEISREASDTSCNLGGRYDCVGRGFRRSCASTKPVSFGLDWQGDVAGGRRDGGCSCGSKESGLPDHHLGGQQRPGPVQLSEAE